MTVEKKELSNEMRKKLADIGGLGFTENPEFKYVLKAYREKNDAGEYEIPKEYWPVFTLQGMGGIESTKLENDMGYTEFDKDGKSRYISKSGGQKMKILKDCLKGWVNYRDSTGEFIEYRENNGKVNPACLDRMAPSHITELVNAITERTSLTHEELEGLES